ncbi:MAG: TlpA family protein disulfide reductase [Gammaproteobacteria bacterium]|nr:TlpA family protein disulfide reductase [Gammaproteobacteria bacterium]
MKNPITRPALVILAGLISLFALSAYAALQSLTPVPGSPMAPDFDLIDLDEQHHTLNSFQGKPVIVNFWATWCPPCREEMPSMERAWQQLETEGIAMIGINVGENFDQVFGFTGEYDVSFPLLLDTDGKATEQWPIRGLPTTYILNPDGKVIYQAVGGRDWEDPAILEKIRALLK